MGIAAGYFYSADSEKQTLHRRIRPTEEQYEEQRDRWNNLADHLLSDLRAKSRLVVSSWLQGSYKFGTQVRPARKGQEFDIDLGVYFNWAGRPEDGQYSPKQLKDFVQASLNTYAEDEENDADQVAEPPKARCSRIHFNGDFHIDVPAYHLDQDRDARSLATHADEWEISDPKAIYVWFKNEFEDEVERAKVRRLVRYLKTWALLTFDESERPSSVLITVLVLEKAGSVDWDEVSGDDEALCEVASMILARLRNSTVVANPVNDDENLNRLDASKTENLVQELERFVSTSDRAVAAQSEDEACDIWSELFEHFFPLAADGEEAPAATSKALIALEFDPQVAAQATTRTMPRKTFTGINKLGPIPRDCDIEFTLLNAGLVPVGASIHWTVRNEGEEAENINDLGHKAGTGAFAVERSAYRGRQFMDVSVRLNGRVIGRRRVPVFITGVQMPPRNPKKKPAYVALRGRR